VEEMLQRYQFLNSDLDLFSEASPYWGEGRRGQMLPRDPAKTPRTTARFIPGYDWNSDRGFFDGLADRAESDFLGKYESSWIPKPDKD
jgi:hypothetical protein